MVAGVEAPLKCLRCWFSTALSLCWHERCVGGDQSEANIEPLSLLVRPVRTSVFRLILFDARTCNPHDEYLSFRHGGDARVVLN